MQGKWWLNEEFWAADMQQVHFNHLGFIERQKGYDVIDFRGLRIQAYDGVYHPLAGSSTHVVFDGLLKYAMPGMEVLEIGCGSGAIALSLCHMGCKVLGSDIDELAVNCAINNARQLNLQDNAKFLVSDMYNALPNKKFDLILFNAPLLHCEPIAINNGMHKRFDDIAIDTQGDLLLRFVRDGLPFLKDGGRIVGLVSNIGSYERVAEFTDELSKIGPPVALYAQYRALGYQWRFVLSSVKGEAKP